MPGAMRSESKDERLVRLAHEALERARGQSQAVPPQPPTCPPAPVMRPADVCGASSNSHCARKHERRRTRTGRSVISDPDQASEHWKDVALARATARGIQTADLSHFMKAETSGRVTVGACSSAGASVRQITDHARISDGSDAGPEAFHGLDTLTTRVENNGKYGDMKVHNAPSARTRHLNQRRGDTVPPQGAERPIGHTQGGVESDTHAVPTKPCPGPSCNRGESAGANGGPFAPASWNISKERYQALVDYMRHYMPLDSPETLSPTARAQLFALIDKGNIPDTPYKIVNPEWTRTVAPSPVNEGMKVPPRSLSKHKTKIPVITSTITFHDESSDSNKQRSEEEIREIRRVAMEFAVNKLARGEPSGQFMVKEMEECCDHPKGAVKRPEGYNTFISSDGREFEVSGFPNDITACVPTDLASTISNATDKPVTRSNRRKGRGRAKRNGNGQSQPQPPTNPQQKPPTEKDEKMAPNTSKMVDESDKSKSLDAYMERYKPLMSQPAQAATKKGESSRIDQAINPEEEDSGQCTNPRCKCNQKYQNRGSTNPYQQPASSNGAEYGSGSEASSREPFKATFEEALLSTCSFSQRVKISPPNNGGRSSNIEGDDLVSKAQNLQLGGTLTKEEAGGEGSEVEKVLAKAVGLSVEHYRQSTISSSLKERERLIRAMRELTGDEKPPSKKQIRPKREEVGECGTTNADIYSGLRAIVAEQFRPPARNADNEHGGLTLPVFLLPGVLDLAMRRQNDAAPPKRRRRRVQYKTVVHPIPEDLKCEIDHWEVQFKEMGIPDEQYMSWMIDRYSSYCKGLEKLQKLVTDMKEGPPSPQIDHILKAAQGATGVAADRYVLKSNGEGSSSR